jgi:hypothetical protein
MPHRRTAFRRLIGISLACVGLATGVAPAPALAQDADQTATGPVVKLATAQATVATPMGPVIVQFGPDTRFELDSADQLVRINTSAATMVTHPVAVGADTVQEGGRLAASEPVGPDGVLHARVVWIPAAR